MSYDSSVDISLVNGFFYVKSTQCLDFIIFTTNELPLLHFHWINTVFLFVFIGEHSDITIIIEDERIPVHFLVLFARCRDILDEVIQVNGQKYIERWSNLSNKVVKSFLSYLYGGIADLKLTSTEDLNSARFFSENYPKLEGWKLYVKSIIAENEDDQTF